MATSKVRPLGQIGTSRDRWRVRFSNGVIALIVLGLALVVLAMWSHFSSITQTTRGERVSCGSLADPRGFDIRTPGDRCSGAVLIRHVVRAGALLATALFVVLPLLVTWARRRIAPRSFILSDGVTSIRWVRRKDRQRLRGSIDDDVLEAMGWSEADRDAFLGSLTSGWGSGVLVITETGIDQPIGALVLIPAGLHPLVLRVAFWVAPSRRGMGHAGRAVPLVVKHLVEANGVVIAEAGVGQEAAAAVLESAGLRQVPSDGSQVRFTTAIDPPDAETDRPDAETDRPDAEIELSAPAVETPAVKTRAAKSPAVGIAVFSWMTLLVMVGLLTWSVIETITEHTERVAVAVPAGEIDCGSLASRVDHDIDSYNRRCDGGLLGNEANRFRGIAGGSLSLLGVLAALGMMRMLRSATPAENAPRSLTPAQVRDAVRNAEPLADGVTSLRAVRASDAGDVASSIDEVVMTAMGWPAGARDRFEDAVAYGLMPGVLVVTVGDGDRAVGVISLEPVQPGRREPDTRRVQVGTWMGPASRGQGHMGRALGLAVAVLIECGIDSTAETAVANIGARRAFERAGFVEAGRRTVELPDGTKTAGIVYGYRRSQSG